MKIKFRKLHKLAQAPVYKTSGACAADVSIYSSVTIKPNETAFLKTGLAFEIPQGFYMAIYPRSSLCLKQHLVMPHSVGLLDSDYRDELMIVYKNIGTEAVTFEAGERVAQLVIQHYEQAEYLEGDLNETERKGGFGSTGKI